MIVEDVGQCATLTTEGDENLLTLARGLSDWLFREDARIVPKLVTIYPDEGGWTAVVPYLSRRCDHEWVTHAPFGPYADTRCKKCGAAQL